MAAAEASPRCIRSSSARPNIGEHRYYTRDHETRRAKLEAERAALDVPPIITEAEFEAVQAALKACSPQWMSPRAVSGPALLTGICFFASCGGAMTLRTGKGSAGGTYRYYICSMKAGQRERDCRGLTVPMDKLDRAVADHLEWRCSIRRV